MNNATGTTNSVNNHLPPLTHNDVCCCCCCYDHCSAAWRQPHHCKPGLEDAADHHSFWPLGLDSRLQGEGGDCCSETSFMDVSRLQLGLLRLTSPLFNRETLRHCIHTQLCVTTLVLLTPCFALPHRLSVVPNGHARPLMCGRMACAPSRSWQTQTSQSCGPQMLVSVPEAHGVC